MQSASTQLLPPEVLGRLSNLRLEIGRRTTGALVGRHRSPLHGSSIEFAEHKEYSPGDEIRHIDWKAFGRFDKYYVKRFEDETNLRTTLLVDSSGSMGYGGEKKQGGVTKLQYASQLAAALAFVLLRQQDGVGVTLFRNEVVEYVPVRSRGGHLEDVCRVLLGAQAKGKTQLTAGLSHAEENARRGSLVAIFSDFFDHDEETEKVLVRLARRHNVVIFHVLHPDEIEFPFDQLTIFRAMEETSEVLAEPQIIRQTYLHHFEKFLDSIRTNCVKNGIDYHLARTDQPIDRAIVNYATAAAMERR